MGHQKLKALVIKKLREIWPGHIHQDMRIWHYKETRNEICFTVENPGQLSLQLLQAFSDLFGTKDVTADIAQVQKVEHNGGGSHIWTCRTERLVITIRNGSWTNIHRSRKVGPDHRFDLEVDE